MFCATVAVLADADDTDVTNAPAAVYENRGGSFVETLEDLQAKSGVLCGWRCVRPVDIANSVLLHGVCGHVTTCCWRNWPNHYVHEVSAVVVNPATRALGKRPHSFARVGRRSVQDDSKITWVTVLTFVVVYLISLVSVTLIGQGLFFGGQVPDHISTVFSPTFTTQCGRTSCA